MKSRLFILNLITSIILVSFNIAETVVVQKSQNCIKKTKISNRNYNDDVEEARDILRLQSRSVGANKRWRGKKVLYKIENMPECSDGLTVADVSEIVDAAAGEWNSVPRANVLWVVQNNTCHSSTEFYIIKTFFKSYFTILFLWTYKLY